MSGAPLDPGAAVEPPAGPRHAAWPRELAVVAGYLLLAVVQTRIHGQLSTHCYGGGRGDPGQDGWVLARVTAQLLHEPWRPFEGNIYYPSHASLLYKDPLVGPAVLVLPLRALGANPVLLYNAAIVLSLLLASWGCYRVARRLGAPSRAALLAGVVVPYAGPLTARLIHLNLLAIPFFPLLLWGLVELLERPRLRPALATGVSFALQAATSGYHAFSAALLSLVTGAWAVRRARDARLWLWGAVALALALGLLRPYVSGFAWLSRHEARMQRDPAVAEQESLDLSDLASSQAYVWRPLLPPGHPFFPGLVVLVFAGRALRDLRRDRYVRLLLLIVVVTYAFALGPQIRWRGTALAPGPFALAARLVPRLDAMRHPHTLAVPGVLALGLLAALGLGRSRRAQPPAAVAGVLLLATLETLGEGPARRPAPVELPAAYGDLARLEAQAARRGAPRGATLELPFADRAYTWWAGFHDLPIVNGVGSFEPDRYQRLFQVLRREWKGAPRDMYDSRSLEYLRTWFPVRWVLLHPRGGGVWRAFVEATPRGFVFARRSAGGERLYRLRRGGRGRELRRAFRDDQLRSGWIEARVAGTPGAAAAVSLNDAPLDAPLALAPEPRLVRWSVAQERVRYGLNLLELRAIGPPSAEVEIVDIDAGEAVLGSGAGSGRGPLGRDSAERECARHDEDDPLCLAPRAGSRASRGAADPSG